HRPVERATRATCRQMTPDPGSEARPDDARQEAKRGQHEWDYAHLSQDIAIHRRVGRERPENGDPGFRIDPCKEPGRDEPDRPLLGGSGVWSLGAAYPPGEIQEVRRAHVLEQEVQSRLGADEGREGE